MFAKRVVAVGRQLVNASVHRDVRKAAQAFTLSRFSAKEIIHGNDDATGTVEKRESSAETASYGQNAAEAQKSHVGENEHSTNHPASSSTSPSYGTNVDQVNPSEDIHPDWLALERRLSFRKPKPRDPTKEHKTRSEVRNSAWDAEHV